MPAYKVIFRRSDSSQVSHREFMIESDSEAVELAESLNSEHFGIELRQGERLVFLAPPIRKTA
jgi:hypothetical protein